jgi:hypothetical protein
MKYKLPPDRNVLREALDILEKKLNYYKLDILNYYSISIIILFIIKDNEAR